MRKKICFLFAECLILYAGILTANSQSVMPKDEISKFKDYVSIPLAGNCWAVSSGKDTSEIVTDSGIKGWKHSQTKIQLYFKTDITGNINLAVRARIKSGFSICKFRIGGEVKSLRIDNNTIDTLAIGTFNLLNPGYQMVVISGDKNSAGEYAEISDLLISQEVKDDKLTYVKDDFYWGRRGPSVHLNYQIPANSGDIVWFYNEILVPKGNDVTGSYFMANGFGEGYFGIQVNSPKERRILFSVWSPSKTDHPDEIPEDEKIILLQKGNTVHAGNFGDEGSGGQSFLVYPWKAETKYRFLVKGIPSNTKSTDYTAYFFDPEIGHWELIASFRRPKTSTYLKHLHSFLENFIPENGNISRIGLFSNQWICNSNGEWTELNKARFTADATARKGARLDYEGGTIKNEFYLRNCGFFNEKTDIDTWFTRPFNRKSPSIDFKNLP